MRMTGNRASDFLTVGKGPDAVRADRIRCENEDALARLDAALAGREQEANPMTDTTAPLAVTMETIKRVEASSERYAHYPFTVVVNPSDLRALTALARRCLEPGAGEKLGKRLPLDFHEMRPEWVGRYRTEVGSAAIAALVNPDGK